MITLAQKLREQLVDIKFTPATLQSLTENHPNLPIELIIDLFQYTLDFENQKDQQFDFGYFLNHYENRQNMNDAQNLNKQYLSKGLFKIVTAEDTTASQLKIINEYALHLINYSMRDLGQDVVMHRSKLDLACADVGNIIYALASAVAIKRFGNRGIGAAFADFGDIQSLKMKITSRLGSDYIPEVIREEYKRGMERLDNMATPVIGGIHFAETLLYQGKQAYFRSVNRDRR
jgi:hypothetical protein